MKKHCKLLVFVLLPAAVLAQDTEDKAQQALAAKNYPEARAIYTRLLEQNPENTEYLLWVARLSAWLHQYPSAMAAYDQVLARESRNIDAIAGKSYVLMWQRRYNDAETLLREAEKLAPDDAEISLALARLYFYQNHRKAAQQQVARTLALNPESAEARELKSRLAPLHPVEVRLAFSHDGFSFTPPGQMGSLTAGYAGELSHAAVHYERWVRFGEHVNRGGASFSRRVSGVWLVRGGAMVGPGATVLPRQDYTTGFSRSLPHRTLAGLDFGHLRFSQANVNVATPSLEYYFKHPMWVYAALSRSWTNYVNRTTPSAANWSFLTQLYRQAGKRVLLRAGYARGNESFSGLSVDRLGRFSANTYIGGFELKLTPLYSAGFFYSHQRRSNGLRQDSFNLQFTVRQ